MMQIPVVSRLIRKRRLEALVDELGTLEEAMRDCCARIVELTDQGDDLSVSVQELLEALDG